MPSEKSPGENGDPQTFALHTAGPGSTNTFWAVQCAMMCGANGGVYRPDKAPITDERARQIYQAAGYVRVAAGRYVCPACTEKASRQRDAVSKPAIEGQEQEQQEVTDNGSVIK